MNLQHADDLHPMVRHHLAEGLGVGLTPTFTPVVRRHQDCGIAIREPADFAAALGYDLQRIAKTLFVLRADGASAPESFALVTFSCGSKLDFRAVAQALGWKRCGVGRAEQLDRVLAQAPMGVSPIGAHGLPVVMDEALMGHATILVGAGVPGVEVELPPDTLRRLTGAQLATVAAPVPQSAG